MATIIVEDGSIVPNANSYVDEATLIAYAADRGITIPPPVDTFLITAMDYIEAQNYQGEKVSCSQPLQWPRTGVVIDGCDFPSNAIPQLLQDAQCEAAIADFQGNNQLAPIDRKVKKIKVGGLEKEYADNSSTRTNVIAIDVKLQKLLSDSGFNNGFAFSVGPA